MNNIEDRYTSLELSKKLKEGGCEIESDYIYACYDSFQLENTGNIVFKKKVISKKVKENPFNSCLEDLKGYEELCNAYDLIWDICIKHSEAFFGQEVLTNEMMKKPFGEEAFIAIPKNIMELLQEGQKEYAEELIWQNCLFNKDNKEK